MSKKNFDEILTRFLKGQCTPDEIKEVNLWFDLIEKKDKIPQSEHEWNAIKEEIWSQIAVKDSQINISFIKKYRKILYAAASIVFIIGFIWIIIPKGTLNNKSTDLSGLWINKINNTDSFTIITLPDNSQIKLAPASSIKYLKSFTGNNREVYLSGKAFFNITKNPNKPFLVYSQNITTRVLGTSFWIEPQNDNSSIVVKVVTGKVSVFENKGNNQDTRDGTGVIITPNFKVKYLKKEKIFITGIVENPNPILNANFSKNKLIFDDSSISEILSTLEEIYGINIEVETENLLNCTLTADLNSLPFFTAMDIICQSINAKYEIKGTSVLMYGKGCN